MRICFASHNPNKVRELKSMLTGIHEVYGLHDLNIHEDIPETGDTIEENSRLKAQYVYDRFKVPVFADDSGLLVDHLKGAPGVHSARFAGEERSDEKNIQLLLKKLDDAHNRNAHFKTIITFLDENGLETQFEGKISGTITQEKKGNGGFGYDPVFQPKGYDLTFAEISAETKNKISHRAIAVQKLIEYLHQQQ